MDTKQNWEVSVLWPTLEEKRAHKQPHTAGERHHLVICISYTSISEALCRIKCFLPAPREDFLNYREKSELPQAKNREEKGRSDRQGHSVVHKDLDSHLFFAPTFFVTLGSLP